MAGRSRDELWRLSKRDEGAPSPSSVMPVVELRGRQRLTAGATAGRHSGLEERPIDSNPASSRAKRYVYDPIIRDGVPREELELCRTSTLLAEDLPVVTIDADRSMVHSLRRQAARSSFVALGG